MRERPTRARQIPRVAHEAFLVGAKQRIGGLILVVHEGRAAVLDPHLPDVVAREAGVVAPGCELVLDRLPHRPARILVMSDDDRQPIGLERVRIIVQIVEGVVVERVAVGLRPFHEQLAIERPAGVAVVAGIAVVVRVRMGGQAGHGEGGQFGGGHGPRAAAGQPHQAA